MELTAFALLVIYGYCMFLLGKTSMKSFMGQKYIEHAINRAFTIPVGVIEEIDGNYYLYEKDTTNFLCQSNNIEDIPMQLWKTKNIAVALVIFPESKTLKSFWCVNGKLKAIQ